jgi:S-adenosylmethionine synthetase
MKRLVTCESVCIGHPDKFCDQVADAVLDEVIGQDPMSRVACEVAAKSNTVFVAGEITTTAKLDVEKIVRSTALEIGYTSPEVGFDFKSCKIITMIEKQSPDIAQGVDENRDKGKGLGAGDQGIMFGYASNETKNFMPLAAELSRRITNRFREVREQKILSYIRPDGKSQVTIEYNNSTPARVHTVIASVQHDESISMDKLRNDVKEHVIKKVVPTELIDSSTSIHINPTGRFVLGGPFADCGMTGRKNIVDTYGGVGRHGGGSFSGKDPTKVDRSACYASRHAAKNVVAAGLAAECEVHLAYAIGLSQPVAVDVETFGTGKIPDEKLAEIVRKCFDFSPGGIIEYYNLRRPIFKNTARLGHFGIELPEHTWEKLDKVEQLRKLAGF